MMHKTIKKVGDDLRDIKFNTAVAALMEWLNHLSRKERVSFEEYRTFLLLIAPFAPHVAEELFQAIQDLEFKDLTKRGEKNKIGNTKFASVHAQRWPEYDEKYLMEDMVTIIVQVNGKVRDNIKVEKEKIKIRNEVELQARQSSKVQRYIKGKIIRKVIYVEGKLVNFVTL
jgi:leucyl-tRNA synthetase